MGKVSAGARCMAWSHVLEWILVQEARRAVQPVFLAPVSRDDVVSCCHAATTSRPPERPYLAAAVVVEPYGARVCVSSSRHAARAHQRRNVSLVVSMIFVHCRGSTEAPSSRSICGARDAHRGGCQSAAPRLHSTRARTALALAPRAAAHDVQFLGVQDPVAVDVARPERAGQVGHVLVRDGALIRHHAV